MRSWICGVVLSLGFFAGAVQAAEVGEVQKRAEALLPWVGEQTGYPTAHVQPVVVLMRQNEMNARYYGPLLGKPKVVIRNLGGATLGQTIFLPTWFKLGTHDHLLVHELAHVLQNEYGGDFPCFQAREREAYEVENVFIDLTGVGEKQTPLMVALFSYCPPSVFDR